MIRHAALVALAALAVAGCKTVPMTPSEKFIGDMVVSTDYAQFFRLGPQQAGGADRSLRTGERVMLLRKEFGYSRVQLEDDQVGYMANEDIQAAPPEPKSKGADRRGIRGGQSGRTGGRNAPQDEDYPVDDTVVSEPSLNIQPEEIELEPLPELLPEPVEPSEPRKVTAPPVAPPPTPPPTPVKEHLPTPAPEAPPVSTST